ncbi:MAG: hypothetical protein LBU84_16700 [Prevotella sp.]|jgi:hypothetical protein|nr:hypothetical protein [Prevotella sp.]
MKKTILISLFTLLTVSLFAQNQTINGNLIVKNPMGYPYGLSIDVDFPSNWAREFSITHNKGINMFSIGAYADNSKLLYGYIGGGAINNINSSSPWMVFLPSGNIGVGTKNPTSKLQVEGTVAAKGIYINNTENLNGRLRSYLRYPGDALIIGSPEGNSTDCVLDFLPGGVDGKNLNSRLNMYVATGKGVYSKKIQINANASAPSFFNGGNIGIGTESPQSKLDVRGKITASEVEVKVISGADFVFQPDYNLMPLSEVESFVKENQHLPEIPSEKEMVENGVNVNEMQIKLLQKVEELTLYIIQQEKQHKMMEKEIQELKEENKKIKKLLNN